MNTGILAKNSRAAYDILKACELCPRRCGVNRLKGKKGFCGAPLQPIVYSWFAHPGEEPPISGARGSGTIFFAHCTMRCVYCQNYKFSQLPGGKEITADELAGIMLSLPNAGGHNVNLETPTHFIPQILEALCVAVEKGLNIPIVYNTGGYDAVCALRLLDGVVDIYLPDMRYGSDENAMSFSNAPGYVKINQEAVSEMFRQVGSMVAGQDGIAKKGLVVRHLVLPNGVACSEDVFRFLSERISKNVHISLMGQYHPAHRAFEFARINRGITKEEYEETFALLVIYGLVNGGAQEAAGN